MGEDFVGVVWRREVGAVWCDCQLLTPRFRVIRPTMQLDRPRSLIWVPTLTLLRKTVKTFPILIPRSLAGTRLIVRLSILLV